MANETFRIGYALNWFGVNHTCMSCVSQSIGEATP